jgi:beta-fructofuranosidase
LDPDQLLAQQHTHMLSVSVGVCPAIYWLGRYKGGKFDLVNAEGPYALDMGDVVYAPNLMVDKQVGWKQGRFRG